MLSEAGTQPIETARLLLRRFTPGDAEDMWANWAGDGAVQQECGEPVYGSAQETARLLARYVGAYGQPGFYRWAVVEKESGRCVGQTAYFLIDEKNGFAEIEYCIGQAFQGKGYATEAVKAVIAYGFERMGLHKVQVSRRPANVRSGRVIEKCGFVYEGTLRDYFRTGEGRYEDRMYYSLLEGEWRALREKEPPAPPPRRKGKPRKKM